MPAGEVQFGDLAKLEVNDGASNAYAEVVGLEDLKPPMRTHAIVDRRILNADPLMVGKEVSTRVNQMECTFTYESTDAAEARLDGLRGKKKHAGGAAVAWRITLPDGTRYAFNGVLYEIDPQAITAETFVMSVGKIIPNGLIVISDVTA